MIPDEPANEEHGLLREQPPALEVGQVWEAGLWNRKITRLTSEFIFWAWDFNDNGDVTTHHEISTWTEWRDWQQRHAARVQEGGEGE